jgi:hypothetical protein
MRPDDLIFAGCLRGRGADVELGLFLFYYLPERVPDLPPSVRLALRDALPEFRKDLRDAGWVGPHPPGRGLDAA